MRDLSDPIDRLEAAWRAGRPDLDIAGVVLGTRLLAVAARLTQERGATFDRHGLGDRGFDVLVALWHPDARPGRTPGEIARAMPGGPVSSGGVTFLVDRLERQGLVARAPHPTDRRAVMVSLTEDGWRVAMRVMEELTLADQRTFGALAPAERDALAASLRQMFAAMDADR